MAELPPARLDEHAMRIFLRTTSNWFEDADGLPFTCDTECGVGLVWDTDPPRDVSVL